MRRKEKAIRALVATAVIRVNVDRMTAKHS